MQLKSKSTFLYQQPMPPNSSLVGITKTWNHTLPSEPNGPRHAWLAVGSQQPDHHTCSTGPWATTLSDLFTTFPLRKTQGTLWLSSYTGDSNRDLTCRSEFYEHKINIRLPGQTHLHRLHPPLCQATPAPPPNLHPSDHGTGQGENQVKNKNQLDLLVEDKWIQN